MKYTIELHPEALKELTSAFEWYEEKSTNLGVKFITLLNNRLNEIAENPDRYAKKKGNYREVRINIFPYTIIYEVLKKRKVVFVSYIFHSKRNPLFKYKR